MTPRCSFVRRSPAMLAAAVLAASAAAQAAVITFDPLASVSTQLLPAYAEAGYDFGSNAAEGFASWGTSEIHYAGSAALFNAADGGFTTLSRTGGGLFSLDSIDLSEVYKEDSYPGTTLVTFTAVFADFSQTTFTVALDNVFGFQTHSFAGLFEDVLQVSWLQQGPAFHQFDNLVLRDDGDEAAVPEPGTLALLGAALVGLAASSRRGR